MSPKLYIGTSGWSYAVWRQDFYKGVAPKDWLAFYAEHFKAVEINASFYREQDPKTFQKWKDNTPKDFAFAVKGHRFITHVKRLKDPLEPVKRQRQAVLALGSKLSAMLWQLPRNFVKNPKRLSAFAETLKEHFKDAPHALEFRHASWFDRETEDLLRKFSLTNCISDAADWPRWDAVTSNVIYLRLHGAERTYRSEYGEPGLKAYARRIRTWLSERRDVHVYFDNTDQGAAVRDALKLKNMLGDALPGA